MNKAQTEAAIKVMQAYVDGEKIESSVNARIWSVHSAPNWNWEVCNYRIKPKPVEFKVWYKDKDNWSIDDYHVNDNYYKQAGYRLITVREVV